MQPPALRTDVPQGGLADAQFEWELVEFTAMAHLYYYCNITLY